MERCALGRALPANGRIDRLRLPSAAHSDLRQRTDFARRLLELPETTASLVEQFLAYGFIEAYLRDRRALGQARNGKRKPRAVQG